MLLEEIEHPFDSDDFLYELKFDGARATIHVGPKVFKIYGRRGTDLTNLYPELKQIQKLVTDHMIFDGEIVLFQNGKPSFSKLQERSHLKDKKKIKYFSENFPVCFIAFDILYKNKTLINFSLLERKKILEKCQENDYFIKTKYIIKEGKKLFKQIKKIDLEGIVAKKIDSIYEINTRSKNWLKIKNWHDETFFIGGYQNELRQPMIKLYLGEYKENRFQFVGKVMASKKQEIYKKIINEKIKKISPFDNFKEEEVIYVTPKLTCEISYLERTEQNHLRQAIFKR